MRVIVVSDPLCSWCWGMAGALEVARRELEHDVAFDLILCGINVDSRNPVGDYGRFRLARLWREVREVTGQPFAAAPPTEPFVYNSSELCVVLEAVRERRGAPPFDLLWALQRRFFAEGENVTAPTRLTEIVRESGEDPDVIELLARSASVRARTSAGFVLARSHGTHAMPNLVFDDGSTRRLLAGGYLDAPTLVSTIAGALRRNSPPQA